MAKVNFYKLLQKGLEQVLFDLGFKLVSKSGGTIYYNRQKEKIKEGIRFVLHRFSPEWNIELEKPNNDPPVVELKRLIDGKVYVWWSSSNEEEVVEGLKEAKEILLNEGLRWFEGKIDYWKLFEEKKLGIKK
jgi:hypothetical protein